MSTVKIEVDNAEWEKVRGELVRVRNENERLRDRAAKAESRADKATQAKAAADRALKETKRKLDDSARQVRAIGAPLIAREGGEVFLVLRQAARVTDEVMPVGTPVARVVPLNGATLNFVVDGYRSGIVTDRAPTSVAEKTGSGIGDQGSGQEGGGAA